MNFLACGPGRPVVSRMKGMMLMCWYLSNLVFSALLAMCPGRVLAAGTRDGLQEKRATMETSRCVIGPLRLKTRSMRTCSRCQFTTRVRAGTSCSMNTLEALCDCLTSARHRSTAACLRSTPPQYRHPQQWCCLLCVHWFVADEARCALVGARLYNVCGVGGRRVREHHPCGY